MFLFSFVVLSFRSNANVRLISIQICPLVKGVGWATVIINFMMAMFYNTIISWAVYYLFMSFRGIGSELPWRGCSNHWNTKCCVPADIKPYEYRSLLKNITRKLKNGTSITRTNTLVTTTTLPKGCDRFAYSTEEFF